MHWCHEETIALLQVLSFLPFAGLWIRSKLNKWREKCHENKECDHVEGK